MSFSQICIELVLAYSTSSLASVVRETGLAADKESVVKARSASSKRGSRLP